jgi:oligopeptide transport system substrate-binding protein
MKKISMLLLLGVLVAVVACGPASTPTPAPTTAPAQPTTAPAAPTVALAATAAPAATTASVQPAPTTVPVAGVKVLRLGRAVYPDVIDPQRSSFGIEIEVLKLCYEGLTALDYKGNVGPGAADTYKLAADGLSMTFHIRDGLKRADGTAMNASDFEYALKREVDPNLKDKQYSDIVHDLKGAQPLIDAEGTKIAAADLAKMYADYGVKADDSTRTLTVTFAQPTGFWHYIAYTWVTYAPDKAKSTANPDTWWQKADGHACYGPYTIKTLDEGKRIVYQANPNYWRGKPKIDRIEATYITDEIQRFEAYKKGEFDEVDVTPASLDSANTDPVLKAEFVRYPAAATTAIAFNSSRPPFSDVNVRKAFSYAFDREGYIRDVLKGIGKPYTRWLPPGVPAAQPDKPGVPAYDPVLAVKTLVDNGYAAAASTADKPKVDCAKLGDLKITYASTPQNHARFQFIAGNFVRVFNCPVTIDPVDATVMTALTKDVKTNPQISRQGWIQDYPHPQNWLSVYWKCAAFAKRYGYCNKDLDTLMSQADATVDFDASLKLYAQVEDKLLADVPAAFAYYTENLYLVKPYLSGLKQSPSSGDQEWAGEWGPVWTYDIDLSKVPASYPKQ